MEHRVESFSVFKSCKHGAHRVDLLLYIFRSTVDNRNHAMSGEIDASDLETRTFCSTCGTDARNTTSPHTISFDPSLAPLPTLIHFAVYHLCAEH